MKNLRLTIRLHPNVSKAKLANLFGDFIEIRTKSNRFIQFKFESIRMLTAMNLKPIFNLLQTYEKKYPISYKMFHLYDDSDGSYAPIYLEYFDEHWQTVASSTGKSLSTSKNLFNLI